MTTIAIEPTAAHIACRDAVLAAFADNQISYEESLAIVANLLGQGAARFGADLQIVAETLNRNFLVGYHAVLDTTGMSQQ